MIDQQQQLIAENIEYADRFVSSELDRKILYHLYKQTHTAYLSQLAKRFGVSRMAILKRVRRMENFKLLETHKGLDRRRRVRLNRANIVWVNAVLTKVGIKNEIY